MANDAPGDHPTPDAAQAAAEIGAGLSERGIEYALGGALALGCWTARPRATIDADFNLFIPHDDVDRCLDLLRDLGCQFDWAAAIATLRSHGFCRVGYRGRQIDFFLPITEFHEEARRRRVTIDFQGAQLIVLDAESICVFKLMFFRLQDLADVEALLRAQGARLDRAWMSARSSSSLGPGTRDWRAGENWRRRRSAVRDPAANHPAELTPQRDPQRAS